MFKNLIAEKAIHRLSNQRMAEIVGISRPTFEGKMKNGHFTAIECWKLIRYFGKTFEYLFATDDQSA